MCSIFKQKKLHFFATGLQSYTFDVSDVARTERKLSVITAISQASKSGFFVSYNINRRQHFSLRSKRNWDFVFRLG